jgi:hypothetical protein
MYQRLILDTHTWRDQLGFLHQCTLQGSSDFNDNVYYNQGVRSSKGNSQTQNQTSYTTSSENAQNDKLEKDQSNTYLLLR